MIKPSVFRVIAKDVIDFLVVFFITWILTLALYYLLPSFKAVSLSLYFFEQFIELFFVNPRLFIWFLGLGFGVNIIYYMFCAMLYQTTLGGKVMNIIIVDRNSRSPLKLYQALLMALGSYVGVLALMWGPLSAWWLNVDHRGFSEKLSATILLKRVKTASGES